MALPGPLDRTPEPTGDRPAACDITGDVWQRQGPYGTATWFCATDQAADPRLTRGHTWDEVDESILGPLTPWQRPPLPDVPYTGSFAMPLLAEADTDPISIPA
jgi:hypothetical protein